ncbi:unnamed protein product [Adineta steineri]|uniref:Rho-GAP domain-containing protein n=1 Tax=Adineta steineri TaxID=433720 RepID=A0A813NVA3_9BILA|nr:unnamed protein product [Adineta steineri]
MSSNSVQQIRPVIECFCQILSLYGFSSVTPEIFRLAKFNGHEYPYSIKMKHLKTNNAILTNHRSFDGDDDLALSTNNQHNSTTSLNNVPTPNYHDFELRKRDISTDNQSRKYRFFHKRKTKTQQQLTDGYHSSSTPYLSSPNQAKSYSYLFGRSLDELILRHNHQLPPVIMQLFEILYVKGPETTGIFRKVANTRSVKECIDKIENNIALQDDDLHPILAAGIFKHFLRSLPESLFTSTQYDNWKKCLRFPTLPEKISFARKTVLSTLSEANHLLLKGFICILYHISEHASTNGMNPFNLDNQSRKYRFFHKRKTKTQQQLTDGYHSSSTPYLSSPNQAKSYSYLFGRSLDELILRHNHQLPPVIMQLFEILYVKGPETTGIFRKVANARLVKECIDKIENNIALQDDDLHPILAAGIFKHFLRSLPESLFTSSQYDNWKKCLRFPTLPEKISFARKT